MRILYTLLFCFLTTFSFAQSQSTKQKTLVTKRTATWCPNCGNWGWDFAKALEELENDNAILVKAHYSGDLLSQAAVDITKNFDAIYQPEFYLNEVRQDVGNSSWSGKVSEFDKAINENAERDARVGFEISANIEGSTITTEVTLEVLQDLQGNYFLATYLLEDGVINDQSGRGNDVVHDHVLRASLTGESFGQEIFIEGADAGSTLSLGYENTGEEFQSGIFRILTVVWKKEGERFTVENVHSAPVQQFSSVEFTMLPESDLKIYQRDQYIQLEFNIPAGMDKVEVTIMDVDGQVIHSFPTPVQEGMNEVATFLNNDMPRIVLVSISDRSKLLYAKKSLLK
ncbi:Omp28-related outer membrane protein [Portibacter marinus]|uniref:Omp28-related outer membrane protein n=1 Tax=Portibacter marinus TaxID=2898660 RepID=UPI001F22DF1A|nr:Omp28-related outer membrane protein [Portibacter marinus]